MVLRKNFKGTAAIPKPVIVNAARKNVISERAVRQRYLSLIRKIRDNKIKLSEAQKELIKKLFLKDPFINSRDVLENLNYLKIHGREKPRFK